MSPLGLWETGLTNLPTQEVTWAQFHQTGTPSTEEAEAGPCSEVPARPDTHNKLFSSQVYHSQTLQKHIPKEMV